MIHCFRIEEPLGHFDFYLNGGEDQSRCYTIVCDHNEAHYFLTQVYSWRKNCQSNETFDFASGERFSNQNYSPSVGDIFSGSNNNEGSYFITENC